MICGDEEVDRCIRGWNSDRLKCPLEGPAARSLDLKCFQQGLEKVRDIVRLLEQLR